MKRVIYGNMIQLQLRHLKLADDELLLIRSLELESSLSGADHWAPG